MKSVEGKSPFLWKFLSANLPQIVYDQNHYFGSEPIPKLKPTLPDSSIKMPTDGGRGQKL